MNDPQSEPRRPEEEAPQNAPEERAEAPSEQEYQQAEARSEASQPAAAPAASEAPRPTPPQAPPQQTWQQPQWQQQAPPPPRNGRMMPPGYQPPSQWSPPQQPYPNQPGPYGPPPPGYPGGARNMQRPQGRNRALPLIIGLVVLVVVVGIGAIGLLGSAFSSGSSTAAAGGSPFSMFGNRIGVLEIEGVLGEGVGYGANTEELVDQVKAWTENDSIKAMVLRINSPGGAVSATQDLVHAINEFRGTGRPVYASMGDVAASGGYYAATAADEVYANEGTLTGSIGVIMSFYNYEGLLEKIGVYSQAVKSGEFKDMGSGTRQMTEAEQALLDGMVQDVYQQFLDEVVAARAEKVKQLHGLREVDEVREHIAQYADGRIFSGRQAYDYGMVDELGTLEETIEAAANKVGLSNYSVVHAPVRPKGLFGAIGALSNKAQAIATEQAGTVKLEYRLGF